MGPCRERRGRRKIATVGISAFAVEALTDLVFIELPEGRPPGEGRRVVRRDRIGQGRQRSVQPGDRRSDRREQGPAEQAGNALDDPYGAGWIVKIKIDATSLAGLLDYTAIRSMCEEGAMTMDM